MFVTNTFQGFSGINMQEVHSVSAQNLARQTTHGVILSPPDEVTERATV